MSCREEGVKIGVGGRVVCGRVRVGGSAEMVEKARAEGQRRT